MTRARARARRRSSPTRSSACSAPPTCSRSRRSRRASGSPRSRRSPPSCRSSPPTSTCSAASSPTARARCCARSATPTRSPRRSRASRATPALRERLRAGGRRSSPRVHAGTPSAAAHERAYEAFLVRGGAADGRARGHRDLARRLRGDRQRARPPRSTIDEPESRRRRRRRHDADRALCAALASCFCLALAPRRPPRRRRAAPTCASTSRAERAGRELRYGRIVVTTRAPTSAHELAQLVERARRVLLGVEHAGRSRRRSSIDPRRSHERASDRDRRRRRGHGRRHDRQARSTRTCKVTLFTEFPDIAYSPCGIPFVHGREIDKFENLFLSTVERYVEDGLDMRMETTVTDIDLDRGTVTARNTHEGFDKLVVCTGFDVGEARRARRQPRGPALRQGHPRRDGVRRGARRHEARRRVSARRRSASRWPATSATAGCRSTSSTRARGCSRRCSTPTSPSRSTSRSRSAA